MAGRGFDTLSHYLRSSAAIRNFGRLADAELLSRFVATRDGAAFEVLV
jgi:hypothetical protein